MADSTRGHESAVPSVRSQNPRAGSSSTRSSFFAPCPHFSVLTARLACTRKAQSKRARRQWIDLRTAQNRWRKRTQCSGSRFSLAHACWRLLLCLVSRSCRDLESAAEKLALQQEHAPRDLQGMNDALLSFQENGEYLQEFNERIDVLMAVCIRSTGKCAQIK